MLESKYRNKHKVKHEAQSIAMKRKWEDPEFHDNQGKLLGSPEVNEKKRITMKKLWETPEFRERVMSAKSISRVDTGLKRSSTNKDKTLFYAFRWLFKPIRHLSDEHKQKLREGRKQYINTHPEVSKKWNYMIHSKDHCKKISDGMKAYFKKSESRIKQSKTQKARFGKPGAIEKHTEAVWGGFWYGNVRYNNDSRPIYCEKWRDVNPRVHAFFDNTCCVCGMRENGRKHMGHHVFYVKQACCWYNDDGEYYTNLNAKEHPENDYYIGYNPNYFVLLCPKCHGKTNGSFENRKKWADFFRDMIDTKYKGKCFLTKEEFADFDKNTFGITE